MRNIRFFLFSLIALYLINAQAFSQVIHQASDNLPVVVKLSEINNPYVLQERFQEDLDFPYYYGKNWDAFYDCVSEKLEAGQKITLVLRSFAPYRQRFPHEVVKMLNTFADLKKEYPKSFNLIING